MPVSGANLHVGEVRARVCRLPHFDRCSPPGGRSVAEPTIAVVSPGVGVPVAAHSQRMILSGAHLHVGEICGCVCKLTHFDRRIPLTGRPVAELAILVVSPGVGVPVAARSQGKTIDVIFSSADLAEPDASAGAVWRGDGGGFPAPLAALIRADAPRAVPACGCPLGGQGQVLADGSAEIVGDVASEPSVEQVAFPCRVGGGPLHPATRGGEMLVCGSGASSVRIESDGVGHALPVVSGQRLVDLVVEVSGEELAVLPAGDEDCGWPRFVGGYVRLPGTVVLSECQCLAVHTG